MVSIVPKTLATGSNRSDKQVSVDVWNAGHDISGTAHTAVAFDEAGAVVEIPRITPHMFGAVGDGVTDDSLALQEFFDHAAPEENARQYIYDWSGRWFTTRALYACYAAVSGEIPRRFICGTLTFPARSSMQGGALVDYAMTIGGTFMDWQGTLYIHCAIPNRDAVPYKSGVRLITTGHSIFEHIHVHGALKDAVYDDPSTSTVSTGASAPLETSYAYSNNIGRRIGKIYGRYCGGCSSDARLDLSTEFTANQHWNSLTASAGFVSTVFQRSRLTVASTDEFDVHDFVRWKHRLDSTDYGTLAFDNTARTITRSTGDWTVDGLQAGDKYIISGGSNGGRTYEVLSLTATVLTVWPAPITEAATSTPTMASPTLFSKITSIPDATTLEVFPALPSRLSTGSIEGPLGFAYNSGGPNIGNTTVGSVAALVCGGGYYAYGLYGSQIGSLLLEYCDLGMVQGRNTADGSSGTVIDHFHFEAVGTNFIQVVGGASSLSIKGSSAGYLDRFRKLNPISTANELIATEANLQSVTIDFGGRPLANHTLRNYRGSNVFTDGAFGNNPWHNRRGFYGNSGTIYLTYDATVDRLFGEQNWCELFWIGTTGAAPTGTLTFALTDELVARGWTIWVNGAAATTATATKPCVFKIRFYANSKLIFVEQLEALGGPLRVSGTQVVGAQQAAIADLTVTATAGTLPTADGTVTIADAATPTNAELLEYCRELEAKIEASLAKDRTHGLIAT